MCSLSFFLVYLWRKGDKCRKKEKVFLSFSAQFSFYFVCRFSRYKLLHRRRYNIALCVEQKLKSFLSFSCSFFLFVFALLYVYSCGENLGHQMTAWLSRKGFVRTCSGIDCPITRFYLVWPRRKCCLRSVSMMQFMDWKMRNAGISSGRLWKNTSGKEKKKK